MNRITSLDAIRGLAICGIIAANAPTILKLGAYVGPNHTSDVLAMTVSERFFPLFSIMFGVSFGIIAAGALRRGEPYRRALLQRVGFLGVLGLAHQTLQPGEALLPYALASLVILLPATWLPTWLVGSAGAVLTGAAIAFDGGLALVPGLMLLGFAAARADLVRHLDARRPWIPLGVAAVAMTAAWPLLGWLSEHPFRMGFSPISAAAGLLMASAYAALVVAAMASPLRGLARGALEPFGRMALTNYIGATLLLLAVRPFTGQLGVDGSPDGLVRMLMVCAAILALQWWASRLWLARFGQGPLERVWRRVTWAGIERTRLVTARPHDVSSFVS